MYAILYRIYLSVSVLLYSPSGLPTYIDSFPQELLVRNLAAQGTDGDLIVWALGFVINCLSLFGANDAAGSPKDNNNGAK